MACIKVFVNGDYKGKIPDHQGILPCNGWIEVILNFEVSLSGLKETHYQQLLHVSVMGANLK